MTKKYPLLLLDADVVIKAFEQGIWDGLVQACGIHLSRIVAEEAHFWDDGNGDRHYFDLQQYAERGQITIVDVIPSALGLLCAHFDATYLERMHPGETELLAYLVNSQEEYLVCSADKIVYQVLGRLGKAEQGISLAEVLKQIGLGRSLPRQFSKAYREEWTRKGGVDRIEDAGWQGSPGD